jgi:hypothetical protein
MKVETRFDKMFSCLCFGRELGNTVENVTCKRDLRLRDRDVWFSVRDETFKKMSETETRSRPFKKGSRDETSETETTSLGIGHAEIQPNLGYLIKFPLLYNVHSSEVDKSS